MESSLRVNIIVVVYKRLLQKLIEIDSFWKFSDTLLRRIHATFFSYRTQVITEKIIDFSAQKGVISGPFQGIKYPRAVSSGSTILPKLLGTYETELHCVWKHILSKDYRQAIDIGCAEGYYAVGLASHFPMLEVFAFDISLDAQQMCKEMAFANGVNDRIHIGGECSADYLNSFNYKAKTLILCDCEGVEKNLFTKHNCSSLEEVDLLIEMHDFIVPGISTYLKELFHKSHEVKVINSISDSCKPAQYECPLFEENNAHLREIIFSEGRPDGMQWIFLKSRT